MTLRNMSENNPNNSENSAEKGPSRLDGVIKKSTTDSLHNINFEAVVVVSSAVEQSKTVGGFGVTILTACALIAASPWSWLAAILLGPVRVWAFFNSLVIGGVSSALAAVVVVLLLLGISVAVLIVWMIFR